MIKFILQTKLDIWDDRAANWVKTTGLILQRLFQPHIAFAIIATFFGLIFVFINPPFYSPDEPAHFNKIIALANGDLGQTTYVPEPFQKFWQTALDRENAKRAGRWTYTYDNISELLHIDIQPDTDPTAKIVPLAVSTSYGYSPAPYVAPIAVAWLGLRTSASPAIIFYATRLATMFLSTYLIFCAIRIAPVLKWQLFLISLFPMTTYLRSSLSADPLTTSYAYLFFAIILQMTFSHPISNTSIRKLSLLSTLLCLSKSAYMPLCALFFLIPKQRLQTKRNYYKALSCIVIMPILIGLSWLAWTNACVPKFYPAPNIDAQMQLGTILHFPILFLTALWNSWIAVNDYSGYLEQIVGRLGWLDITLPFLTLWKSFYLLFLIPASLSGKVVTISPRTRALCIVLGFVSWFLISFFEYLIWTPVGSLNIQGVQGRYFLPIMPLLLLAASNHIINPRYYKCVPFFIVCCACYLLTLTTQAILGAEYGISLNAAIDNFWSWL